MPLSKIAATFGRNKPTLSSSTRHVNKPSKVISSAHAMKASIQTEEGKTAKYEFDFQTHRDTVLPEVLRISHKFLLGTAAHRCRKDPHCSTPPSPVLMARTRCSSYPQRSTHSVPNPPGTEAPLHVAHGITVLKFDSFLLGVTIAQTYGSADSLVEQCSLYQH